MASFFGASLARAGHRVTLAGTWRTGLATAARQGLRVQDPAGEWAARVETLPLDAPVAPHELVLVLVKSHQTAQVAGFAARAAGIGGWIVTLQNGFGNREALERVAGRGRVGLGVTTAGATLLAPGLVRAFPAPTLLGDDGAGRAARVAALFRDAGLACEVSSDLAAVLWRKLAVNCAINPLSALAGVVNGALLENEEWRTQLEAAAREAGAVARALGVALDADPVALALETARRTAGNRSSMLQDLDRDARTEIDAINGAVVALGQSLGVPTPVNAALTRQIHEREAGRREWRA
jgi:2-dehydropantoate 2-reductase